MSAYEETPKHASEGRDGTGRFTKGNPGGPGNPFARRVAQLRSLLLHEVTDDDLAAIVGKLVELARAGDVAAAKLVLQYTLGKPVEQPHPDRVDADELQTFQANTAPSDVLNHLLSVPVGPALELMRTLLPYAADHFRQEFHDQFVQRYGADGHGGSFAHEQAAVNEPTRTGQPATNSADPTASVHEAETIRLVNEPGPTPSPRGARAANKRRP